MSTFYLINPVTVGGNQMLPGDLIDDAVENAAAIRAAGGLLWPSSDAIVAAAAATAQNAHRFRGANEAALESIMQTAVQAVQKQSDQFGTGVLVGGTLAIATAAIRAGSEVQVAMKTPGGTTGVHYAVSGITPGSPGSFTITAVDTAGAPVATDTSTISWHVLG